LSLELDGSRLPCPGANDDQCQTVEGIPLRGLEGFESRGIAVVRGHDFAWPSIWNWMWFFERGTNNPFLSATVTVMNERSWPSARIFSRSACKVSFAAGPVVFIMSVAIFYRFYRRPP